MSKLSFQMGPAGGPVEFNATFSSGFGYGLAQAPARHCLRNLASGNQGKFRHDMFQVYTFMIDIPGIYLPVVYDKIYFPNKVHVFILLNDEYMSSISTSNIYNEVLYAWRLVFQEVYCVKDSSGISLESCFTCNGHVMSCNYIHYILDVMGM
jgi:hypothetical protein